MQLVPVRHVLYTPEASARVRERQRRLAERLEARAAPHRWVYALGCGEFIKFGQALNFERRIKAYATHNPFPVQVLGKAWVNGSLEGRILAALSEHLHRGEWFRASDDVLELVVAIKSGSAEQIELALKRVPAKAG